MKKNVMEAKLHRLKQENKGLLCIFVMNQIVSQKKWNPVLHLKTDFNRGYTFVLKPDTYLSSPVNFVHPDAPTAILTAFEEIEFQEGCYNFSLEGNSQPIFADTKIFPGKITILAHLQNEDKLGLNEPELLEYFEKEVSKRFLIHESMIERIENLNLAKEKHRIFFDLDLILEPDRPSKNYTRVEILFACLKKKNSECLKKISPEEGRIQFQGTNSLREFQKERLHNYWNLIFDLGADGYHGCLDLEIHAQGVFLAPGYQKREDLKANGGPILISEAACRNKEVKTKIYNYRYDILNKREGLWQVSDSVHEPDMGF